MKNFPAGIPPVRFFALLACACVVVAAHVEGAIVSVNGGFETFAAENPPGSGIWEAPSVAPWTVSPDQTDPSNIVHVAGADPTFQYGLAPHAGNIAATFWSETGATGAGASLTQRLTTSTANTYDVSLWIANPIQQAAQVNNVFSLSWNGQLLSLSDPNLTETSSGSKAYVIASDTAWFQLLLPNLAVTGASTDLVISARNNDWATLVDDVIVQETPEPSTVVMLCAGAALMGARRRRPQRIH